MSPAPKKSDDSPHDEMPRNRNPDDGSGEPPAVIMNANMDSDSDASDVDNAAPPVDVPLENAGYQLLSSDPNGQFASDHETVAEIEDRTQSMDSGEHERSNPLHPELLIPHQPRWESVSLDEDKVEDIKSRMSTFLLPPSQHPVWATEVTEDVWKEHLLQKIRHKSIDDPK